MDVFDQTLMDVDQDSVTIGFRCGNDHDYIIEYHRAGAEVI